VDDLFATHDALAVAQLIKQRKLGTRELLDGTLARLRTLNGSLNAITPFETASTPVIAAQPLANVFISSHSPRYFTVLGNAGGGAITGIGCPWLTIV